MCLIMAPESKGTSVRITQIKWDIIAILVLSVININLDQCFAKTLKNPQDELLDLTRSLKSIFPSSIQRGNISSGHDYVDPGEILSKVLVNHTMEHGAHEDLDHLIFSTIPEGSKLVLQSVKVYQTDEHGNPLGSSTQKTPVHWDVKLTNATNMEEEESSEEDEEESEKNERKGEAEILEAMRNVSLYTPKDLDISGSHSQEKYKVYGTNSKVKEKGNKNYHGTDHGKSHKVVNTDTDGVKYKNYHGKEHGVTDYKNDLGKAINDQGERYRDTKKKNKGRRVSGFKRVYHKEEFQRTEHFYDDEDAKRIAESYGIKDAKEHANHGLKDDDRKYHGKKTEYLDGNKIKNEKGTSNKYTKGILTEFKDSEKHKHNTHYNKAAQTSHGHPNSFNAHYHPGAQNHQSYHPSHNYHASYSSHPNYFPNNVPYDIRPHTFQNPAAAASADITADHQITKAPMIASFVTTGAGLLLRDSSTSSSTDADTEDTDMDNDMPVSSGSDKLFRSNKPTRRNQNLPNTNTPKKKPEVYFSPRYRKVKEDNNLDDSDVKHHVPISSPYKFTYKKKTYEIPRTTFRSKIGNYSDEDLDKKNYTNYYRNPNITNNERYARKYHASTVRNTLLTDPPYGSSSSTGYSTLVKLLPLPVNYISLDPSDASQSASSINHTNTNSDENLSEEEDRETENTYRNAPKLPDDMSIESISFTTNAPPVLRRPPSSQRGKWISISFGDPEVVHDHPFMPSGESMRPITLPNIIRGVRQRFTRPRPGFSHGHRVPHNLPIHQLDSQFDTSKYPPNVVVINGTKYSGHTHTNPNRTDNALRQAYKIKKQILENQKLVSLNQNLKHPIDYPWIKPIKPMNSPHSHNGKITRPPNYGHGQRGLTKIIPYRHSHSRPHSSLPPFMNNLMDSVAHFFSSVG